MPYLTGPTKWWDVAVLIRDAYRTDLTFPPGRLGIVPGAIAWDDCDCDGGMLAVAGARTYLSDTFPEQQEEKVGAQCDAAWEVMDFVVQLIRCAPQPADGQLSPSVKALESSGAIVLRDAAELTSIASRLMCAIKDDQIVDYMINPVEAQGPEGGCVGNEIHLIVALPRG